MSTKVEHVHFSITGEFVTDHARAKVQEGDWAGAIRFLKTSVIGFTYDHAISILTGEMCLTGTNNIQLVKNTSSKNDYLKQLDHFYGSYVRLGGKWYRPYAFVSNYGPKDIFEFDRDTPFTAGQEVIGDCRARYYCENRTDKIFILKCGPDVHRGYYCALFTLTEEPPIWMQFTKTPQEAVDACRNLKADGHFQRYGPVEDSIYSRLERRFEILEDSIENKQKIEPPIPDTKFKSHLGWVSPTGEYYGCCFTGHIDLSYEIVKGLLNIDDFDNSELELEKRGWLKIGSGGKECYFETGIKNSKTGEEFKLTQAQIDTLHDWATTLKRPFPSHLLEKRD